MAPVPLLSSTVLVAYERDLTVVPRLLVFEALTDGRLMITAALSLAVACAELGGETWEWCGWSTTAMAPSPCCRWRWARWRSARCGRAYSAGQCGWRWTRCPGGWAVHVSQRSSAQAARAGAYRQQWPASPPVVGHSCARCDLAVRRSTQPAERCNRRQRYDTEPVPALARETAIRAAPVLSSKRRCARLADLGVGNVFAMVRSAYSVPSRGSPVQRLAAPQLDVCVPATAHDATTLRGAFRRWVDGLMNDDIADDLALAVYEALANAVDHAFIGHPEQGLMWLRAHTIDGQIIITVTDNGSWRSPTDSGGYRGRGLPLIHQLATEAHVAPSPHGTTVRLRHQLSAGKTPGWLSKLLLGT